MTEQTGQFPLGLLAGTRYPDPRIEKLDKRFPKQGNAGIERIATGFRWAEGPVYFRDGGFLLWSDIPNNRMMRWLEEDGHVSVFRSSSNYSNGNTRDLQGRLVTCEHDTRRVIRTEHGGKSTVISDGYGGSKLNAPNDVVVASDGAIWFTDPGYGIDGEYEGHKDAFELGGNVYRVDVARGEMTVVADDFVRPNGLAFSPDERLLYIVDSGITHGGPAHIRVFDVVDGSKLRNGRVFADHYHSRILATPTELVNAISYVLGNAAHHYGVVGTDPFSSLAYDAGRRCEILSHPRSWLLRSGWRRARTVPQWRTARVGMQSVRTAAELHDGPPQVRTPTEPISPIPITQRRRSCVLS